MLLDTTLEKKHWAEVVNTANYLKNQSPTKCVKFKTPKEALSKKKPDLFHIRTFVCKVMICIQDVYKRNLMLNQKEYLLDMPKSLKVIVSRVSSREKNICR